MIELFYTVCTFCSNLLQVTVYAFAFSRKDSFKVMCGTYLGRLTKMRIGHDNSGLGPGWFLNKASYFDRECWILFLSLYSNLCILMCFYSLISQFCCTDLLFR